MYNLNDYNLKWFGTKLQQVRKAANLSQNDVSQLAFIHPDTLRRIETGKNPPRLETIKILSTLYKTDLLHLLSECTNKNTYNELFNQIDKGIIEKKYLSHCNIKKTIEELKEIETEDAFLKIQKLQLISLGDILILSFDDIKLEQLLECIRISIPEFMVETYLDFSYNYIELRVLLLIGLHFAKTENFSLSNSLLHFLEEYSREYELHNLESKKLHLKILSNLSYNYFKIEDDSNSLKYAELGIKYSVKYDTFYLLHHFYFRKAISLLYLRKSGVEDSINNCFAILKLTNKEQLLIDYKHILTKKYNIDSKTKIDIFNHDR